MKKVVRIGGFEFEICAGRAINANITSEESFKVLEDAGVVATEKSRLLESEAAKCDHDWSGDGGFYICTKCGELYR